jgi:hypothetical protein
MEEGPRSRAVTVLDDRSWVRSDFVRGEMRVSNGGGQVGWYSATMK